MSIVRLGNKGIMILFRDREGMFWWLFRSIMGYWWRVWKCICVEYDFVVYYWKFNKVCYI